MNIKPFLVEEWMNRYEAGARYNIAETCVDSISLQELWELSGVDGNAFWADFCGRRLTYGDIEGLPSFREGICGLYRTLKPENIIPTHGAAGANHHVFYSLINPGDRVVSIMPTYQQLYSIPESFQADLAILSLSEEWRIVKTKGLKYMVEAMKDVDCRLIICGNGPETKNLEKQIASLGLQDRIEMRGFVPDEEKNSLMNGCKFFVMPSLFESFGIAAIELMSHSRPLVCTNVNGLPATVGEGGITVDPADPKALADAMNRLLADEGLRREMGEKAFKHAVSYSYDDHIPRYESILEAVAQGKTPEPD